MSGAEPRVLVLASSAADDAVFRELLADDYPALRVATSPTDYAASFDAYRPDVVVLAMREVSECERHYADLLINRGAAVLPHRTLLLCDRDHVRQAFALCKANRFDDYVLFWPMAHDALRLSMSIHHALRFRDATRAAALLPELTMQARRIGTLEDALAEERSVGSLHAHRLRDVVEAVGTDIRASLETFGRRLVETGLDEAVVVRDIAAVMDTLEAFDRDFVRPPVRSAVDATLPVRQWVDALPERLEPQRQAARALGLHAARAKPLLLVIDDDEFMRKLLLRLLRTGGFDAEAVGSAAHAMTFLHGQQPDLILMDIRLPDIDGIALTRQLKAIDAYVRIPVIMLTGQSQQQVLADSRHAGAADFIVKPFERETLLKKVSLHLSMPV